MKTRRDETENQLSKDEAKEEALSIYSRNKRSLPTTKKILADEYEDNLFYENMLQIVEEEHIKTRKILSENEKRYREKKTAKQAELKKQFANDPVKMKEINDAEALKKAKRNATRREHYRKNKDAAKNAFEKVRAEIQTEYENEKDKDKRRALLNALSVIEKNQAEKIEKKRATYRISKARLREKIKQEKAEIKKEYAHDPDKCKALLDEIGNTKVKREKKKEKKAKEEAELRQVETQIKVEYANDDTMRKDLLNVIYNAQEENKEKQRQYWRDAYKKKKEKLEQTKTEIKQEYANDDNMRDALLDVIEKSQAEKRAKFNEQRRKKKAANQKIITRENSMDVSQEGNSIITSNEISAAENNVPKFPKLNKIRFEFTLFGNSKNNSDNREEESNSFSSSPRLDQ